VIAEDRGWRDPLVEQEPRITRRVTYNAGLIAIGNPSLINRAVWFCVKVPS